MSDQNSVFLTDDLRDLLRLITQTDITDLKIERDGAKLHIKRGTVVVNTPATATSTPATVSANATPEDIFAPPAGTPVTSPMVGTFYAAPSPKDPAYVKEGDEVHPGDVVGIVEAMKMMNEIESEIHGRVIAIHVENGQPIEYGQLLMTIVPLE